MENPNNIFPDLEIELKISYSFNTSDQFLFQNISSFLVRFHSFKSEYTLNRLRHNIETVCFQEPYSNIM